MGVLLEFRSKSKENAGSGNGIFHTDTHRRRKKRNNYRTRIWMSWRPWRRVDEFERFTRLIRLYVFGLSAFHFIGFPISADKSKVGNRIPEGKMEIPLPFGVDVHKNKFE